MDLIQGQLVISQPNKHVPIDKFQYFIYFLLIRTVSIFPFLFLLGEQTLSDGKADFFDNSRLVLNDVLEILIVESRKIIIVFKKQIGEPYSSSSFLIMVNYHIWMMLSFMSYHIQKLFRVAW